MLLILASFDNLLIKDWPSKYAEPAPTKTSLQYKNGQLAQGKMI